MADKLFLTADDFTPYRDISEHIDTDRLNTAILEAQISDLVAYIGEPLYKKLQDDFTAPNVWTNTDLEDLFEGANYKPQGKQYDVIYHGLRPMLTYFAYARLLTNLQLNATRTGVVTYLEADVSEPTTQAQIKTKVIDARAMASRYMDEATQFLQTNRTTYPEWGKEHDKRKMPFKFIKL